MRNRLVFLSIMVVFSFLFATGVAFAQTTDNGTSTLSTIKNRSQIVLTKTNNVYTLTELTDDVTVPTGAVMVKIEGKTYFYTPELAEGTTLVDYKNLASTGHVAMKELDSAEGAIYQVGDKYYGYVSDKLPESSYRLVEVAEKGDNTITKYEKDAETGTFTEKYYALELAKTEADYNTVYTSAVPVTASM